MADTDYLAASDGTGNAALMHITSPRTALATVIQVDTVSGVPAFFIGTWGTLGSDGFITAASARDFFGHVSAGTLVIDKMAPGNTDNGNTASQVVVIKPSTPAQNTTATAIKAGTIFPGQFANFVEPGGGVWTVSSGLIGQMSAGFVWYGGARTAISAIASNTFTASKDTYVDINPNTGTVTYVPVANGAAEPAITASSVRVAKVVTSGSAITSISQSIYNQPMRLGEVISNCVAAGATLTADSLNTTLLASMAAGILYIGGKRLTLAPVVSRVFTASVDTYVDAKDNNDGTATLAYSTVTNGAAAPALAANSIRLAKVVTSGTAVTSITQSGLDSLLNIIYPTGAVSGGNINFPSFNWYAYRSGSVTTTQVGSFQFTALNGGLTLTFPAIAGATYEIMISSSYVVPSVSQETHIQASVSGGGPTIDALTTTSGGIIMGLPYVGRKPFTPAATGNVTVTAGIMAATAGSTVRTDEYMVTVKRIA